MLIFSAIDLYEGKAVRLYQGDYAQMTVYSDKPWELVEDFVKQGVTHLHIVDLEGAKSGEPANLDTIRAIRAAGPLFSWRWPRPRCSSRSAAASAAWTRSRSTWTWA